METGTIPAAEKLRAKFPAGLVDMTRLPGLGPKRARKLFDELGIDSLEALEAAAAEPPAARREGLRAEVRGDGARRVRRRRRRQAPPRGSCSAGRSTIGDAIVAALRAHPAVGPRRAGGLARGAWSTRSRTSTSSRPPPTRRRCSPRSARSSSSRRRRAPTTTRRGRGPTPGIALDLRVVEPDQFGNLLQHFTGSKNHNMALREIAVRRGLHVSEYGVLDDATGETHRCATEEEVYALLGLPWIPPELREDRGELRSGAPATCRS